MCLGSGEYRLFDLTTIKQFVEKKMHWLALLEPEHFSNSKVNGTSFQHQWMPFSQRDAVEQILNKSIGMQITGTLFDKTRHAMYLDHISSFFLQFLTSNGGLGP